MCARCQLGIYDRMKNELLDSESTETGNVLLQTLKQSAQLCLRVCDQDGTSGGKNADSLLSVLNVSVCCARLLYHCRFRHI